MTNDINVELEREVADFYKSNVATAHPTAVELRGITIKINWN